MRDKPSRTRLSLKSLTAGCIADDFTQAAMLARPTTDASTTCRYWSAVRTIVSYPNILSLCHFYILRSISFSHSHPLLVLALLTILATFFAAIFVPTHAASQLGSRF